MGIILSLTPILIVLIGVIVLNKPAKFVAPIEFLAAAVLGVAYFDIDAMLILNTAWKGGHSRRKDCLCNYCSILYP